VDEQILKVQMQIDYYTTTKDALSEILKQVNQLSYNVRAAIDWRKFTTGA
jgi:hypothetical protein